MKFFDFFKMYNISNKKNYEDEQENKTESPTKHGQVYAFIDFNYETNSTSQSVLCIHDSLVIGSKLDTDIHLNQCRIAFYGRVMHSFANKDFKEAQIVPINSLKTQPNITNLTSLKVYRNKCKTGLVERKHDETTIIGKALFKKETNMDLFVGMKVTLSTGDCGYIEAGFGQSGKFKVRIPGKIKRFPNLIAFIKLINFFFIKSGLLDITK